jgi:hypothetical protein
MPRTVSLLAAALLLAGCTGSGSPPRSEDPGDGGKEDSVGSASVDPALAPLVAFLRDDKNLVSQLGPEGTTATNVKKRVSVVTYSDFGRAVDTAVRRVSRNYQVSTGVSSFRRADGLVDLIAVGDMYVHVQAGYGDDSFIDKLIVEPKREEARSMFSSVLPEAALVSADHASTTSTGNYILVLGHIDSGQAIVMTVEYWVE